MTVRSHSLWWQEKSDFRGASVVNGSVNTRRFKPLVILTGAGISAESGIKTFRDSNGLWENHRIEDVASPEGFARDPELVQNFYNLRRKQLHDSSVHPNAAHLALAELERSWEGPFLLVTQNVDNLHERAGSKKMVHMHGELLKVRCGSCEEVHEWQEDLASTHTCSACKKSGFLRPHIVWFGEMPLYMDAIYQALEECEIFVSIGTSGNVYPAAGFASMAYKAKKYEANLDASMISDQFHEHWTGPASQQVTALVRHLLKT